MFCYEEPLFCQRTELQSGFMNERCGIASVTGSYLKSPLYLLNVTLTDLVLKRCNAFPLIKPFFVFKLMRSVYIKKF